MFFVTFHVAGDLFSYNVIKLTKLSVFSPKTCFGTLNLEDINMIR